MAECPISTKITEIPREECIGNSLSRINDNFFNLRDQSCTNYTRIGDIDGSILQLQSLYAALSAATLPGAAKAWLKFDGTKDSDGNVTELFTDRYIYSSYNISSAYKKGIGDYRIFFGTPFSSNRYAVIGTSSETLDSKNNYTWLQPYTYAPDFLDVRIHSGEKNNSKINVDARHISLTFF